MRCQNCGEPNAEGARFCSHCGAPLAAGAPHAGEERKIVSVLFVDLVGFTAQSDDADPEDVRATLRVYHDLLKREIERHGGTVEKFIGDAVMAVFGAPVAHEDDAERAVRAALRIVDAIEELNEAEDLDLSVRGAVNTGEAVVTLGARPEAGEGFVTGDVVNVASRLQGVAPVGGVVAGELTYRATRDQIAYEALEPVRVKGKREPIDVWRALRPRSSLGVDIEPGSATPLVGRDHELTLLEGLFRRSMQEENPQFVTLSGEPGVGKSRLTREFRSFVDDLPEFVYWRQGRCLPYGEGITFWALGEIVKAQAGIADNDDPGVASAKLETAVRVVEDETERDWVRARLSPLVGIDQAGGADREESFAAWRKFLESIAAENRLVLVIEDLHWADPALLAFIEHLADWTVGVRLFVLCTARPELYERDPGWGGGKRNHSAVSLAPLSEEETARLIAALLDQAVLPAAMQTALLDRAGGNPLYAEEFIRMLVDRGALVRGEHGWELVAIDDVAVPDNVHAIIAARLDTLTADRKATLQAAAVVGKVFWAGAVAEMTGRDVDDIREELRDLGHKELIRPSRRSTIDGEAEFVFWHALIRDVAYGQIPRSARVAQHQAAAKWIEEISADRVADHAELLAYHYEQALELARLLVEDVADLEAAVRRVLLLAAERAARLDAAKFMGLVERALSLTHPGERARLEVLEVASAGWRFSGADNDDALVLELLEEARAQHDELAEGRALAMLSYVAWANGDAARQEGLIAESLAILEQHPPGPELAFAYTRAAAAMGLSGRSEESMPLIDRALPVVREFGDAAGLSILLQFLGTAHADLGDLEHGLAELREALDLAVESAPAGIASSAHINLGDVLWVGEGPASALPVYEQAEAIAERRGAVANAQWSRMELMWPRFDLGEWDRVLHLGNQVLDEHPDRALPVAILVEAFRQLVLVHRGDLGGGAIVDDLLVPRAREIGDGQVLAPVFRLAATVHLAQGDVDEALGLVREAVGRVRRARLSLPMLLDDTTRVCLAAGDAGCLVEALDGYTPHLARHRASVQSARATIAEISGGHKEALALYEEAAAAWEAFPHVFEHGHALLGAGRCLLELGQRGEASERLVAARERFVSLGASPSVNEADELIALATAKTS